MVLPRELPGRLDRLGAARDEEDPVQVAGRELGDDVGQLDRPRVRVRPVGVERQLAHLLVRGLADLVPERVADLHREQPGERIEVPAPERVLEVAALAADDDRDVHLLVHRHAREVEPEMVTRQLLQLFVRQTRDGCAHQAPLRRWIRTFANMRPSATTKINVPNTFTCGGAPTRAAPQTKSGNVIVAPELK